MAAAQRFLNHGDAGRSPNTTASASPAPLSMAVGSSGTSAPVESASRSGNGRNASTAYRAKRTVIDDSKARSRLLRAFALTAVRSSKGTNTTALTALSDAGQRFNSTGGTRSHGRSIVGGAASRLNLIQRTRDTTTPSFGTRCCTVGVWVWIAARRLNGCCTTGS